jgi:hypothetical protein
MASSAIHGACGERARQRLVNGLSVIQHRVTVRLRVIHLPTAIEKSFECLGESRFETQALAHGLSGVRRPYHKVLYLCRQDIQRGGERRRQDLRSSAEVS